MIIKFGDENKAVLQQFACDVVKFLEVYRWITDAYVSDFFFKDHWQELPKSWQHVLSILTTEQLAGLLSNEPVKTREVLPLSLLAFKACCQVFSLKRRQEENFQEVIDHLTGNENKERLRETSASRCKSSLPPTDRDGHLHAYFKKHVKPKKQHEITNLGKVIHKMSCSLPCENVVDVGSGLGHLARVLSVGYGLKVTSVEATGTHAPKAQKYDREIDKEIKKKMEQSGQPNTLPCHITSVIHPNMTSKEFLDVLQSKPEQADQLCGELTNPKVTHESPIVEDSTNSINKTVDENTNMVVDQESAERSCSSHTFTTTELESNTVQHRFKDVNNSRVSLSSSTKKRSSDDFGEQQVSKIPRCKCSEKNSTKEPWTIPSDMAACCCGKTALTDFKSDAAFSTKHNAVNMGESSGVLLMEKSGFILTGLHACGDLTPTFLRFYVNCDIAVGLCSVGCCYMKITDSSSSEDGQVGYPMSGFVSGLPLSNQSYAARELACHFADTYYQRLKDSSSHLKIHSYRAALEWLANKLRPDFYRTAVQIPSKKTNNMDFASYAKLGLEKLNIPVEQLTEDLLQHATAMTGRWKDVVAFYTIRLALAPVVETLVLLDRMLFLSEQGHDSALVPIFNPALSPRNFVLLSAKKEK